MKRVLLLAVFAALLVVPAALASGKALTGSYYTGTGYPQLSSDQVSLFYSVSGFPDSGAPYTITDTVTCDNGFIGSIIYGGPNRGYDTFTTGAANCTAVLSYTHANKPPVVLDTISFAVPA